jgi:hypothetical protein
MERVGAVATAERYEAFGLGMILLGALVSFVLSVSLWFAGHHEEGIFVGLWVPSILALGGLTTTRGLTTGRRPR